MTDNMPGHTPIGELTPRQRSILLEMAKGLGYQQIAKSLYLSTRTVEREVTKLAKALGVQGPVAVGARAYAVGILNDEHLFGHIELDRLTGGGKQSGSRQTLSGSRQLQPESLPRS
jgi:DNA-binding CsgD family transcriptional regulator